MLNPHLQGLTCFACETKHDPRKLQTVCARCGMPLRVAYALERFTPSGPPDLWRYARVLPIEAAHAVTLGEGFTPLLPAGNRIFVKDESRNPTGSFKARGMTVAVSMAKALGARWLVAPSAGNAAGALAAYGAAAGLRVTVAMPEDTPRAFVEECRHYGADTRVRAARPLADGRLRLPARAARDEWDGGLGAGERHRARRARAVAPHRDRRLPRRRGGLGGDEGALPLGLAQAVGARGGVQHRDRAQVPMSCLSRAARACGSPKLSR